MVAVVKFYSKSAHRLFRAHDDIVPTKCSQAGARTMKQSDTAGSWHRQGCNGSCNNFLQAAYKPVC